MFYFNDNVVSCKLISLSKSLTYFSTSYFFLQPIVHLPFSLYFMNQGLPSDFRDKKSHHTYDFHHKCDSLFIVSMVL